MQNAPHHFELIRIGRNGRDTTSVMRRRSLAIVHRLSPPR